MAYDGQSSFFRKIIEGGMWLSATSFANKALGLVTSVLILRFLSTYEFGLYKLVFALYGMLSLFLFSGFDQIAITDVMRAKADGDHKLVKRIFVEFFSFKVVVSVFLFAVTYGGAWFAETYYDANIAWLVRIISFFFLISAVERSMNLVFNYYMAFRAMALFTFFEEATKLLLLLFFIFVAGFGVSGVVLAAVASSGITFILFLPYALLLVKRLPNLSEKSISKGKGVFGGEGSVLWRAFLSYGKWVVGLRYVNEFQRNIRLWLLRYFLSTEAVGFFAIAESLYSQLVGLFPIGKILLPIVSGNIKNRTRIRNLLYYGTKYGMPLSILAGSAAVVLVPALVWSVFPQHTASIPIFYIFVIAIITTASANGLTAIFYAEREQRAHFFITFSVAVATLALGAILIPVFGVYGAALEFVATAFMFNFMRMRYLFKRYPELHFDTRMLFRFGAEDREFLRLGISTVKSIFSNRSHL